MSEQQRNVIDGTARASHWRRSSPSSAPDAAAAPEHSTAPTNIASSLLVPAHMFLDSTAATAFTSTDDMAVGEGAGECPTGLVPHAPAVGEDLYVNVFRAAEGASDLAISAGEPSLLRRVHAVLERSTRRILGGVCGTRKTSRWLTIDIRPRVAARPITTTVLTLGVLSALIAVAMFLEHSGAPDRQSRSAARANSLESLKPSGLTAATDPLGTKSEAHRSVTDVRRPNRAHSQRSKKHPAVAHASTADRTNRNQHVMMVHYTTAPATPSSASATSDIQSISGIGSTPTASAPSAPTQYPSSSNSGSGSGSSSRSGNPSQATLRSLVTGAGQCSC
jgi:hypothetical protein